MCGHARGTGWQELARETEQGLTLGDAREEQGCPCTSIFWGRVVLAGREFVRHSSYWILSTCSKQLASEADALSLSEFLCEYRLNRR